MELHAISAREISPDESRIAPAGRRYTLAAPMAVFALNFMDRQILAILIQPIKEDLRPSDAQLGLLPGEREAPCVPATVSAPGGMR